MLIFIRDREVNIFFYDKPMDSERSPDFFFRSVK